MPAKNNWLANTTKATGSFVWYHRAKARWAIWIIGGGLLMWGLIHSFFSLVKPLVDANAQAHPVWMWIIDGLVACIVIAILLCIWLGAKYIFRWARKSEKPDEEDAKNNPSQSSPATPAKQKRRWVWKVILLMILIFVGLQLFVNVDKVRSQQRLVVNLNYKPIVADGAWTDEMHMERFTGDHFVVRLKGGGFHGVVHMPARWSTWAPQHADGCPSDTSPSSNGWVAYWYKNHTPTGPRGLDDQSITSMLGGGEMKEVRLEGTCGIVFYKTG